jgi:S-formylglutathione hydrolase FrmB
VSSLVRRLAVGFVLLASAWGAAPATASLGPEELELTGTQRLGERLLELSFKTPAVSEETRVRILLPGGYEADPRRRYPVLYLLHGAQDDQSAWTEKGDAERITAGWPLIVVMPASGTGGGYADWYNDGAGGPPMWETYHLDQLLPWIDSHFRTVAAREGRAVAGLSMGGYGTMHYAAREPDLFAAAASFSGAVDSNSVFVQPLTGTEGPSQGRAPGAVFGPRATEEVRWRGHNPWDLAANLDGLELTLRTGNGMPGGPGGDTGDPVESEVHEESLSLHRRLLELGIPHLWDDYGPGGHDWYYWNRDLDLLMPDLARVFAEPPDSPSPFTYRSIEPRYEAYGWEVEVERPALEFSELRSARREGFALLGSGTGTVTTAPLYAPGREIGVKLLSGAGTVRERIRVGPDCRLRIEAPLGPGNPYQQYTPQARVHGAQSGLETVGVVGQDGSGTFVYKTRARIDTAGAGNCPRGRR